MAEPIPHGPWTILSRARVYRDPWIELTRDEVLRPDGQPGSHCILQLKAGVSVLAFDADNFAYLTEEFHYGVGRTTIEVVSGGIDAHEDVAAAARRELQEELGITADEWLDLGTVDPFTSVVVSPTQMYLARGLRFGATEQEGTEQIRCLRIPLDEAVRMVMDGRITHGPSCVLILKAERVLHGV